MTVKKLLCKDGGFSTQLSVHVGEGFDSDPLWSSRFNSTNPDAVIATHLDFLRAGADLILTNTYQASTVGYMKYLNLDEQKSIGLIKSTVKLAHLAKDKFLNENSDKKDGPGPMIIGSIGPYGAHAHDGSEYTGSYADTIELDVLKNWHRKCIGPILEAGVDGLAIETIPCQIEAETVVDLLCDEFPDVKFWISLQCKDETNLAHGEKFKEVCFSIWNKLLKRNATGNCLAIGVNCLNPQFVTQLLKSINANRLDDQKIPLVVYPNSGENYDVEIGWYGKEHCVPLTKYIPEWIDLGAVIIGGCCRNYARDVQQIKETIQKLSK